MYIYYNGQNFGVTSVLFVFQEGKKEREKNRYIERCVYGQKFSRALLLLFLEENKKIEIRIQRETDTERTELSYFLFFVREREK